MDASMQQLRQLDAQTDEQMSPGPSPQAGEAAAAWEGGQRQQHDSHPEAQAQEGSWDEGERAAFVLGLHLWGKSFTAIQRLIGSKTVCRQPS